MIRTEPISLDGVLTLKVTRGPFLLGYLQASGWLGTPPSDLDLAEMDIASQH